MLWRKTPAWITFGGAWLSLGAGYINAVGFLGAQQHGLTHVTGQVTRIGIELKTVIEQFREQVQNIE